MKTVYLDNHLLALNKPHGLLTQPDSKGGDSLEHQAKAFIKKKFNKPGNVFLTPVHRLDRVSSGLVLFARTSKALTRLHVMMKNRKIKKSYTARIEGDLPETEGTLQNGLVHDNYRARIVLEKTKNSKIAILHYKVLAGNLVGIVLETGRYHQIRAQLSYIGCPIIGDKKYGSKMKSFSHGIKLTHTQMELMHPTTYKPLIIRTPFIE